MKNKYRNIYLSICLTLFSALCEPLQSYSEEVDENVVFMSRYKRQDQDTADSTTTTETLITTEDNHDYYSVQYVSAANNGWKYYRNLDENGVVVKNPSLQNAHRLAVKISLGFDFVFYGHEINKITIATGGFLYASDFLHNFLTATQYIAPLMANFEANYLQNNSEILYRLDDDAFIVEWRNVYLADNPDAGLFTFQVQLHKRTGLIIASYKKVPVDVYNISYTNHPVKVGLSDAFYWDAGYIRTIYPYHTIKVPFSYVESNASIIFSHRPTCNMVKNCHDCLNTKLPGFTCFWCSKLQRCSDSFDRLRQDWITSRCPYNTTQTSCDQMMPDDGPPPRDSGRKEVQLTAAIAAVATIISLCVLALVGIIVYGYRNPLSNVGQFLIKNRPAEIWRRFKTWKDDQGSTSMHQLT